MNLKCALVHEAVKAFRDYQPARVHNGLFQDRPLRLFALGGQSACFQLMLQSDEEMLVCKDAHPAFYKGGMIDTVRAALDGSALPEGCRAELFLEGFVEDDDRTLKADILLDSSSLYVERRRVQPVFVVLSFPEGTPAGVYHGSIRVYVHTAFASERCEAELPFSVELSAAKLPDAQSCGMHLDLWQHNSSIARHHEVTLWSDRHFEIMERYVALLTDLGQRCITVIASEIPWSGQFCFRVRDYLSDLYEYSMIGVSKKQSGQFALDFSVMDRYIALCERYGICDEIEVFGLLNIWISPEDGFGGVIEDYADAVRVRYYDEASGTYRYLRKKEELAFYLSQIEQHFMETGLLEKVRVVADEPADMEKYAQNLAFVRSCMPGVAFKAALNHTDFIENFGGKVQDFVPIFFAACEKLPYFKKLQAEHPESRVCWYVSCEPAYPNQYLRSDLLESYAVGPLTLFMGLDGFLRWDFSEWSERPRERQSFRYPEWKAGDMCFVYPGASGRPLLSLRYFALLRGMELYRGMAALKELPDGADTLEKIYRLLFRFQEISDFHPDQKHTAEETISLDYDDYLSAFRLIAEGLSAPQKK